VTVLIAGALRCGGVNGRLFGRSIAGWTAGGKAYPDPWEQLLAVLRHVVRSGEG
jgi:hypothetical protein